MALRGSELILVCLVPTPRDMEIARLLGWYRIPLRTAPKVVAVDRLAFYQPASFGDHGGLIEYTASVKGHELTTRGELLKDQPNHPRAREEYYKLQLGVLEKLDSPIVAQKWKRLTFLYTTGEYLLNAHDLNDLVVKSDERNTLWRSLRERADSEHDYLADKDQLEVPEDVLKMMLGLGESSAIYESNDLD